MILRSVKWAGLFLALCLPAAAQLQMPHPTFSGRPPKKVAAPAQPAPKPNATLSADEQKRLNDVIKHMKPKDRKKLATALQKMTPQQKQQLLASVKKELAKPAAKPAQRGW
jgi:hypothetical protein